MATGWFVCCRVYLPRPVLRGRLSSAETGFGIESFEQKSEVGHQGRTGGQPQVEEAFHEEKLLQTVHDGKHVGCSGENRARSKCLQSIAGVRRTEEDTEELDEEVQHTQLLRFEEARAGEARCRR